MISKELLSEVLNQNVTSVYKQQEQYRYTTSNTNRAWVSRSDVPFPNIYELAHKCKEWAWSKSYVSNSIIFVDFESNKVYSCAIAIANELNWKKFEADTEPEAIFKACEYILKDKR